MTRYRKKPQEVEAWQVGSDEPMPEWADIEISSRSGFYTAFCCVHWPLVGKGDWLVKDGEDVKACESKEFEQTYEVVG